MAAINEKQLAEAVKGSHEIRDCIHNCLVGVGILHQEFQSCRIEDLFHTGIRGLSDNIHLLFFTEGLALKIFIVDLRRHFLHFLIADIRRFPEVGLFIGA